jgi:hypothetical protein
VATLELCSRSRFPIRLGRGGCLNTLAFVKRFV